MKIEEQIVGGIWVVRVLETVLVGREGAIALRHVLNGRIRAIIEAGRIPKIVVNLEKVEAGLVDAQAVRVVADADDMAQEEGGEIRLVPPTGELESMWRGREDLTAIFKTYVNEDMAVKSFGTDPPAPKLLRGWSE